MSELSVLVVAILAHGLVSGRLRSSPLTGPMIFVAVGLITGPEALGIALIDLRSEEVIVLVEATLAVVLFSDAVRIDSSMVRGFVGIPARMLGVGLPAVIATGTVLMRTILGLSWAHAALLSSILAATDAALGQAVLTDDRIPARIRSSLNVESGLNDGLALPAVTLFSALAVAETETRSTASWIRFVVEQVGYGALTGVVVGFGGGWLLARAWRRGWADGIGAQLAGLSLVGLAFVAAHGLGGNTFVAAFVAGVSFRAAGRDDAEHLGEFGEDSGQLLASITFVLFGNALAGPALGQLTPRIAIAVVAVLTVGRMAPIALSLLGTGLRAPTLVFLGWFGPRGLASILFALIVIEDSGLDPGNDLFVVVAWTVLTSVVAHGASAAWAAGRYGDWYDAHSSVRSTEQMTEGPPQDPEAKHPRPRWSSRGGS